MAITSIYAPASKFSYFQLINNSNANGGYDHSYQDHGSMYIGQQMTSNTTPGANVGVFGIKLYDLPNRTSMGSIKSIKFSIFTRNSSDGYNGCTARIEYIGTSYNNYPALWRVGSASDSITLVENATATMTTTDITSCANLKNVISNAVSGQYYFFRIVRESGMGACISAINGVAESELVVLTIEYNSTAAYVWNKPTTGSGSWRPATIYVHNGTKWVEASCHRHNGTNFV